MSTQPPPPTDDLDAPLGVAPTPAAPRRRLALPLARIGAGLVLFVLAGLATAVFVVNDPLGGEPRAQATIAAARPPSPAPAEPSPAVIVAHRDTPREVPAEAGGTTINIIDGMSGRAREVRIAMPAPERTTGLDPRLGERGRHGTLPRVAEDGRRPFEAYARAADLPSGSRASAPRVAVLIGGLGISQSATAEAIGKLPATVSLAFAPYGSDLERVVQRARADGHEVFLQVPMEPFDFPDNDPGPQTLLTTLAAERNMDRLHWVMSRFQGYAGLVNFMGARFTSTEPALTPVLREAQRRGLMMIDDGSSARSLIPQVASQIGLPNLRADILLDRVPTPAEVDAQLARLEARAHERGFALAIGSALPVTVDRLAQWARAVESRGLVLVPVSAGLARRAPNG